MSECVVVIDSEGLVYSRGRDNSDQSICKIVMLPSPIRSVSTYAQASQHLCTDGTVFVSQYYEGFDRLKLPPIEYIFCGKTSYMSVDIDGYVWVTPRESGLPIMMQYYTKPDKSYKLAKAPPSVAVAVGNNYFFGIDTSSRFWHIDFVNKNLNYQQELPPMVSLDCCQCDLILLDDQGHVWINQSSNSATLIKVEHLPKITSIACGQFHYLALDEDDQVWAWGSNGTGQLGQLDLKPVVDEPTIVPGLPPIKAIQAGRQHSLFLARDVTELWGCGYNNREQIVNKKTDLIIRSPIKIKVDNDNMSMFLRTRTSAIQMKSARKR